MARDIFCDTGGCTKRADFILTVMATGQTTAFCADHFAFVSESATREFDSAVPQTELEQSIDPGIAPDRIPLVAAVASEIADRIWTDGQGFDADELVRLNAAGWGVTVPTYDASNEDGRGTVELTGIVLSPAELECAIGIVADAMADRVPLPDVPAVESDDSEG